MPHRKTTVKECPRAKRAAARATLLDGRVERVAWSPEPDAAELAHFLSTLAEHEARLDEETRSEVARCVARGSFSQAVEAIERVLERTPRNHSIQELRQLMHRSALLLLRGRLGSRQSRVCPSRGADFGGLPSSFARILALATERPRLGALLSAFGRDNLRAHEQVLALVRTGFLTLGLPPSSEHEGEHYSDTEPPEA